MVMAVEWRGLFIGGAIPSQPYHDSFHQGRRMFPVLFDVTVVKATFSDTVKIVSKCLEINNISLRAFTVFRTGKPDISLLTTLRLTSASGNVRDQTGGII